MEIGEIITYIGTALGGGGLGWLVNWKWGRREKAASVKSDEIETMKKAMEDFYDPLVKKQNERIAELEDEVKTLRREKAEERAEHQKQNERIAELEDEVKTLQREKAEERAKHQKQIDSLQKQITELYRALGIRTVRQVRNGKGQFTSEMVEEPADES